ncbi:uncharacterized protein LOC124137520 [Haliotis rufescens]|uniref:uncharacterized protein LOC124137520 n=1 Tax=Haliotis rufescens TaxID=6454 RepID=UPI00201E9B5F|nr:uncharacterized protein LOC124137520 [Haliotis rufescens]
MEDTPRFLYNIVLSVVTLLIKDTAAVICYNRAGSVTCPVKCCPGSAAVSSILGVCCSSTGGNMLHTADNIAGAVSKGLSTIFIIIIVVAVIIVLGIVGCIVCCVCGCSKRTNGAIVAPAGNQPQVTVVSASEPAHQGNPRLDQGPP